jgi:hypothetical protein
VSEKSQHPKTYIETHEYDTFRNERATAIRYAAITRATATRETVIAATRQPYHYGQWLGWRLPRPPNIEGQAVLLAYHLLG